MFPSSTNCRNASITVVHPQNGAPRSLRGRGPDGDGTAERQGRAAGRKDSGRAVHTPQGLTSPEGLWEDGQPQGGEQGPGGDTDSVPICKLYFMSI